MGLAQVRRFTAEGARVLIANRNGVQGAAVVKEIGEAAAFVELDVRSEEGWANVVSQAERCFDGPIHALVNNAGILVEEGIEQTSLETYRFLVDVMASRQGTVRFAEMNTWAATLLSVYGVNIAPDALIADLSPAQRQFVEIVKALQSEPTVLLLDEPTSTLDADGVRKLTGIIRDLTARGTGIIYVSHRLPEILELADRVTVLRDGVHQGTFAVTDSLSEHDLITLMVGRDIDVEYAAKATNIAEDPVLVVKNLTGKAFQDISFSARKGEILGFAGAEGNGQREVLRALVGLEEAHEVARR